MMKRLIPKIFYSVLEDGLDLFVGCLNFQVLYRDAELAVVERGRRESLSGGERRVRG
jgi:hypothetical protein